MAEEDRGFGFFGPGFSWIWWIIIIIIIIILICPGLFGGFGVNCCKSE